MIRILILVLAAWLAVVLARRLWAERPRTPRKRMPSRDTVQCHHCGVYVPESEAIREGEHYFCSEAHRGAERSP